MLADLAILSLLALNLKMVPNFAMKYVVLRSDKKKILRPVLMGLDFVYENGCFPAFPS